MAGIKQPAVMSAQGPHRIAGTEPFDLPYQDNFATDINGYTVVNANNDGSTWEWHEENNCARYQYCDDNVGDDWLISPDIKKSLKSVPRLPANLSVWRLNGVRARPLRRCQMTLLLPLLSRADI